MALAVAFQLGNSGFSDQDSVGMEDISFISPLVVDEKKDRKVQIILENISGKEMPFRIVSRELPHENWDIHCEGNLTAFASEKDKWQKELPDFPEFSADVIPQGCKDHIKGSQFYERFTKAGYDLGRHFQCIEQGWYGSEEVLCRINTGDSTSLSAGIHPGLMDSLIQTGIIPLLDALDEAIGKDELFIPMNVSALKFYGSDFTDTLLAYARTKLEGDILTSDIAVRNTLGMLILEIRNLKFKKTNSRVLFKDMNKKEDLFYSVKWEKIKVSEPAENLSSYLIFSDENGTGSQLTQYLAGKNIAYTQAVKGDFNPDLPENFVRLFEAFEQGNVSGFPNILFLWGLDTMLTDDDSVGMMRGNIESLYEDLLCFVKAAINYQWEHVPRIWLVTRHAWNISQTTLPVEPVQTGLWGMGRVIALEHPELWGGCVDLGDCESEDWAEALLTAVSSGTNDDQIAVRNNGSLYAARLEQSLIENHNLAKDPAKNNDQIVKPDATYLLTGGSGALGLLTAERLCHCGAKNIALLGRSLPGSDAEKRIEALKQEGVRVEIFQADVSDESALAEVFEAIQKDMPRLRGVVHAAGVLDDGMLMKQTPERFIKVFSPKIFGSWNLHSVTRDIPLDFFVMFSSSTAITGNRGQGNYAAANAFMDGLADYRRAKGLASASISWGPWGSVGMAASDPNIRGKAGEYGYRPIPPETGLEILENLIAANIVRMSVMDLDVNVFTARNYVEKNGFFSNFISSKPLSEIPGETKYDSELFNELKNASAGTRTEIMISYVLEITKQVSGNDEIIPDKPLMEMGFDSLMLLEMRNVIAEKLGKKLPGSLIFDYPTPENLANYILQDVLKFDESEFVSKENKTKERVQDATDFLDEIEGLI